MARTAGSNSLGSIDFQTLLEIVGKDYKGKITVGANWFRSMVNGDEQMVFVRRDNLPSEFAVAGETGGGVEIENAWKPPQTVSESKPQKFRWSPEE